MAAALCPAPAIAQNAARIVVIGGGFGGANSARALKALNPKFAITLIAESETYTAFPLSNAVLAGLRPLTAQQFGYQNIAAAGVTVAFQAAVAIDPSAKTVRLRNGDTIGYDRLVIAPGVDVRFDAIKGYNEAASLIMPHAWTDGVQVALLQRQLQAMPAGGVVVISSPVAPLRCPLGPYERASMIAFYLKTEKPRGKVIVLDSKDTFVMRQQFERAWTELYPGMIEWVSLSDGGNVIEVDPATKTLTTDFEVLQGRRRQRHSTAARRAYCDRGRRHRSHRLVSGRSGHVRVATRARRSRHRRRGDRRRDAKGGVRGQRGRENLRRGDRYAAQG